MIEFESFEELLSIVLGQMTETWHKFRGESGEAAEKAVREWFLQEEIDQESALASMDALVDAHPSLEDLREVLADMVMLRLFNENEETEEDPDEFFESDEWMEIEDQFVDRGSEVLNFFLYLRECLEFDEKPSVEDFIHEYLEEEDEDGEQEDFFIYEELIKYQGVAEGPVAQVFTVAKEIERPELQEVFVPMLMFFRNYNKKDEKVFDLIKEQSANPAWDAAILRLYLGLWQSVN